MKPDSLESIKGAQNRKSQGFMGTGQITFIYLFTHSFKWPLNENNFPSAFIYYLFIKITLSGNDFPSECFEVLGENVQIEII